ncbi:hypothetical protein P2O63_15930 [Escherichia coli]
MSNSSDSDQTVQAVRLQNEYDWLTSDAAVDEALLINEYTFTEAGLRAG